MTPDTYLIYLAAVAVFFATPPDTSQLLIISNSMRHGLRRSLWTIAGDLSANALQMTAAAFGLAAIIANSATAFTVIKWAGVAYLVWIGLNLLLRPAPPATGTAAASASPRVLYRMGFVTSMANPYAVIFFAALFPQFITPDAAILPQLLILGATYALVDGTTLVLWGWAGARAGRLLKSSGTALINRISGALMIGAALLLGSRDLSHPTAD